MPKYPDVEVQLEGVDGNAFSIMGVVTRALKDAGHRDAVDEFRAEAMSGDYEHLLATVGDFVEIV